LQYAVFIWTKWDTEQDMDVEESDQYDTFTQQAAAAGVLRGGAGLHPAAAATTVRLREDEVLMTDGPFVESKEQLAGYYVFECDDLDDAVAWAARIPGARHGAVEIRPLLIVH
jgi:hypothetical protein